MVELLSNRHPDRNGQEDILLDHNEVIAVVDDSPEIAVLLSAYLKNQNLNSVTARSAEELFRIIDNYHVALVLLDIGLPDRDGTEVLSDIVKRYPELGVIMVTGTTDLQVALDCLRNGADDYLTKPVNIDQFYFTVVQTLKKRRLAIENRLFQQELELANFRKLFLHHLNLKMNSAYLNAMELNQILKTILIGITSDEGLGFNRAFLALFDDDQSVLQGALAIGPGNREDAGRIWDEIKQKKLGLRELFSIAPAVSNDDVIVNEIVQSLTVPASHTDHPLVHACLHRVSILVVNGRSTVPIPAELIEMLGEESFVIVPLFSPRRALGVLIADNFITRIDIKQSDIEMLEVFVGQASLAIEQSRLHTEMQGKIEELELVTQELEKSKDLLVKSERYSALGHMSAQLVHAIRNPITSIGGTSRLLAKRTSDEKTARFLEIITNEATKVESTLSDLFSFVSESELNKTRQHLFPLVKRSVMIFYGTMKKSNIEYSIDFAGEDPLLEIDTEQIRQVFLHLIRNSVEAMEAGGELTVTVENTGKEALVAIMDSGSGTEEGDLEKLTDPFYTTKTYGTGMGLTLVEQILERHGAGFSLDRNEPGGMTALVRFPLDANP